MKWLIVCIFIAKKHREVACDIIEKSINSNLKILANNDLYGGEKKMLLLLSQFISRI